MKLIFGYWPSGKATASGAVIHWFESSIPSQLSTASGSAFFVSVCLNVDYGV